MGLWLWSYRWIGVGGVTASIAMAIRLNTMSNWIMWELASLFENIGIVKDGMNTFAHHPEVQDKEDAKELLIKKERLYLTPLTLLIPHLIQYLSNLA